MKIWKRISAWWATMQERNRIRGQQIAQEVEKYTRERQAHTERMRVRVSNAVKARQVKL